jgi:hypothetical protein
MCESAASWLQAKRPGERGMRQKQARSGNTTRTAGPYAGNGPVWTARHRSGTMKPWGLTGP